MNRVVDHQRTFQKIRFENIGPIFVCVKWLSEAVLPGDEEIRQSKPEYIGMENKIHCMGNITCELTSNAFSYTQSSIDINF